MIGNHYQNDQFFLYCQPSTVFVGKSLFEWKNNKANAREIKRGGGGWGWQPLVSSRKTLNYLFAVIMETKDSRQLNKSRFTKKVGSSMVSAVVLFPWTRNFTPHCLCSPRCINGYGGG